MHVALGLGLMAAGPGAGAQIGQARPPALQVRPGALSPARQFIRVPVASADRLRVINAALARGKQPVVRDLNLSQSVSLGLTHMLVPGKAALSTIRVIGDGNTGSAMLYPEDGASLDFDYQPAKPGKIVFDCEVGAWNKDSSATTFTIVANDYAGYQPNLTSQLPTSLYVQHLSFLLDIPSIKARSWIRIAADKSWSFYSCEITPVA